ncbi:MAG: AAA family ATPase [Pseudonocardiaceae bacterium]
MPRIRLLLERDHELAVLDAALTAARDGLGGMAVIEGPPGIGKSRLLAAARAMASGFAVLAARGGELEQDFPWGVVRQLFEAEVALADLARRKALFVGAAAPAAEPLGRRRDAANGDAAERDRASPGDASFAALHGLYWLVVTAEFLRRALAEPPPRGTLPGLLRLLGRCALLAGDDSGAEHYRAAVAATPDPAERAAMARELGVIHVPPGGYGEAVATLERAVTDARAAGEREPALLAEADLITAGRLHPATLATARARADAIDPDAVEDTPAGACSARWPCTGSWRPGPFPGLRRWRGGPRAGTCPSTLPPRPTPSGTAGSRCR